VSDYEWRLSVKYDEGQPRIPAGQPGGGRWMGRTTVSADDKVPREVVPEKVYVGLHRDWYEGYEGAKRPPIKTNGMEPGPKSQFTGEHNRRDTIYVATTPSRAQAYANLYGKPLVLEIDTGKLDKEKFFYDPDDFPPSKENPTQLGYRGSIPPSAIKVLNP